MEKLQFSVSDFVAVVNQTLEFALPNVIIVGEVSGLRISQNKWVRFKLKDENSAVDFFGSIYQMGVPLEDGMVVAVQGRPKLSDKYGFSVSFQLIQPVGEGSIKRGFELLQKKLAAEGLFDGARKRPLPELPRRIAVISSTQAAGYTDFITILNKRFGGLEVEVAHTLVQGVHAPAQIIKAIEYFNSHNQPPDVLVLVRGGGDPDDLAAFNDEGLIRAIAGSRVPTLVGVGHETDTTLVDLAADVRAATPSNAAEILVPDRRELIERSVNMVRGIAANYERRIEEHERDVRELLEYSRVQLDERINKNVDEVQTFKRLLAQYDPQAVLKRGYAIVRGNIVVGSEITIERQQDMITAEVTNVRKT